MGTQSQLPDDRDLFRNDGFIIHSQTDSINAILKASHIDRIAVVTSHREHLLPGEAEQLYVCIFGSPQRNTVFGRVRVNLHQRGFI